MILRLTSSNSYTRVLTERKNKSEHVLFARMIWQKDRRRVRTQTYWRENANKSKKLKLDLITTWSSMQGSSTTAAKSFLPSPSIWEKWLNLGATAPGRTALDICLIYSASVCCRNVASDIWGKEFWGHFLHNIFWGGSRCLHYYAYGVIISVKNCVLDFLKQQILGPIPKHPLWLRARRVLN